MVAMVVMVIVVIMALGGVEPRSAECCWASAAGHDNRSCSEGLHRDMEGCVVPIGFNNL